MTKEELLDGVKRMDGQPVLVLGDLIADIYLDGRISRISREAPVLVLEEAGEKVVAGGAANVANNVATLGGAAYAAGVIGGDSGGAGLMDILESNGADTCAMVLAKDRPTISKTRVIAGGRATVSQQIVRIDKSSKEPLKKTTEAVLEETVMGILPSVSGVVLSDYGNGTITQHLRKKIFGFCRDNGIPSIVDSRYDIRSFPGTGFVKQNDSELAAAVGHKLSTADETRNAAMHLIKLLAAKGALITRGEGGMMLYLSDGTACDIPVSDVSEVYDVSGAGDTCVATFITALAGGASPAAAAVLSNIAAGIAVRKRGTATVSRQELTEAVKSARREAVLC